jgi:hypothetical protein
VQKSNKRVQARVKTPHYRDPAWDRRDRAALQNRLREKCGDEFLLVLEFKLHAVSAAVNKRFD